MDAFEQVVSEILWMQGYWVRTSVKVELTKEEKHEIGRPSSPRWELDVVGYRGGDNVLQVVECKSYLDSVGVKACHFDLAEPELGSADRYKLFNDPTLRRVVFNRLALQLAATSACREAPTIRLGAALAMTVADVYTQNRRLWVRLREKGGKVHAMPCHHNLEDYLAAYLDGAGLKDDPKGPLFRTIGRGTGQLTRTPLPQASAHAMIQRRTAAAGIETKVGNHSFRATGITAYLKNGGTLEKAAAMANHASTRTTQLYDRRRDEMSMDEIERIQI